MGEDLQLLEQEFCPPIDPALVHAVYADFDGTPDGLQLARELLDGIKQTALEEQATDFDPSGSSSSGAAFQSSPSKPSSDDPELTTDDWTSETTVTDSTTLSNGLSSLSLGGASPPSSGESVEGGYFTDTAQFDTPTKELLLAETFPTLRFDFIAYTLKKCNNDFGQATDELLNHVYFEDAKASPTEEIVVAKGIDAFSEEYHVPQRGKRHKGRRKQKISTSGYTSTTNSESDSPSSPQATNKWLDGNRDVAFIASRTKLSTSTVSSLYHRNGASISATLLAMIEKDITDHRTGQEPETDTVQNALQLVFDFPCVNLEHAVALIRLSAPSTANAHELAKALSMPSGGGKRTQGGLQVIPRYAPIHLSDPTPESSSLPLLPPSALPRTTASLSAARGEAFTQASGAYRKGKSDPLMKAAAGYYSQVGRDLNANLKAMNEADADALVLLQSSSSHLDLHGVSVHSATRIAKARTQIWWNGLGEQRIPGGGRRGVGDGYRIITGLGRHSEGGRGKIGPAVVKALVREGWKVEVGSGELVVLGLARRK
ncbi:hypothetical protein K491DRAFT_719718 [Lophiostoma macrostomum CBS 122681]|uniref:Smr domain-containing protein n=1 Tax=Lophiostoma macrostomum CBS 122681 TaxID=1314788 RepID=A0A6A6SUV0_9PLEO|nr:hypothetical protein K491DRAFT_719718 [Lophiostoma macrostomum CBS 122681]